MSKQFKVKFSPSGRGKAKCNPNPAFPNGMTIDLAKDKKGCVAKLPYPAPECGVWIVKCDKCHIRIAVTAAGRPDDPKAVIVPCK